MNDDIISFASIEGLEKAMGPGAAQVFAQRLLAFLAEKAAEIPPAFHTGDAVEIRNCVHKLASNAAALGALRLSSAAREIEALCVAGEAGLARARQADLQDLADRSIAALRARLGGMT